MARRGGLGSSSVTRPGHGPEHPGVGARDIARDLPLFAQGQGFCV
ncbi:hypothetical protein [Methylobacterium sp. J-070]|nr:hypothetical protein [Methylobacterium sp. J-070]